MDTNYKKYCEGVPVLLIIVIADRPLSAKSGRSGLIVPLNIAHITLFVSY